MTANSIRWNESEVIADSRQEESGKWRPTAKVLRDGSEVQRIESPDPRSPVFQGKKEADDWIIAYIQADVRIIDVGRLKPPA